MASQQIETLLQTYNARSVYLTPSGEDLLADQPEVVETFMGMASDLAQPNLPPPETYEWIGRGNASYVYGVPGHENVCAKLVSQETQREHWLAPSSRFPLPNLKHEAQFMDKVGRLLHKRPEHGISAPQQYAVAAFAGGSVLLQERIPANFVTFTHLGNQSRDLIGDQEAYQAAQLAIAEKAGVAYRRIRKALGYSLLNLGISDIRVGGRFNWGNLLVEENSEVEHADMYIIDLVSKGMVRKRLAGALGIVHPRFLLDR